MTSFSPRLSAARRRLRRLRTDPTLTQLRRIEPVSDVFGLDRGLPIDRWYIERFLSDHAADIRGRVMEIGDNRYTTTFGGDRVEKSEVLHVTPGAPETTLIGDLATGEGIPEDAFDCTVLTQTLPFIYDVHAAVRNLHRSLKTGGVALLTVPGISQISRYDMDRWGDFWRFTDLGARRLMEESFGEGNVEATLYGNALTAASFLYGLSAEELTEAELSAQHQDYQVIVGLRAIRR
jgi:SAM-dependent methyltransferase